MRAANIAARASIGLSAATTAATDPLLVMIWSALAAQVAGADLDDRVTAQWQRTVAADHEVEPEPVRGEEEVGCPVGAGGDEQQHPRCSLLRCCVCAAVARPVFPVPGFMAVIALLPKRKGLSRLRGR